MKTSFLDLLVISWFIDRFLLIGVTFKHITSIQMLKLKDQLSKYITDRHPFAGNNISYLSNGAISAVPVQEVFLDNNVIETIETWAFGPKVNTLYLSCNRLDKFSPRWFQNATALKELDLSGNAIDSLQGDIFAKFVSLSLIVLSHNKIAQIGPGAFANRDNFRILYLDNNQLTEISGDMFVEGAVKIESIHLQNNRLTFLGEEFIEKTNTTKARISGNPWQCPCYDSIMRWNSWEKDFYNKVHPGVPKCVDNPPYQPDCTPVVDFEIIEEYEKEIPPRETKEQFCRFYLQ